MQQGTKTDLRGPRVAPVPGKPSRPGRRRKRTRSRQPGWSLALTRLQSFFDSRWGDAFLLLALFAFALMIRYPNLLRLPHFTDETVEIKWALSIWRGEIRPLTASDRYYGPLHPYLVAGLLALFGPSIALPRIIVMVFGALTVALTYLLGRALAGRLAGLLGAALLATAPQHILVNSHIAWQNSTTPFYATLTFLALTMYLKSEVGSGKWEKATSRGTVPSRNGIAEVSKFPTSLYLPLAGFAYGLTLNTHVGTIVLAPALALTFLAVIWRAGAWRVFRTPWPWLAPVAGVVAYGPVLYYNLTNNLAGVERVQTRRNYAYETQLSWEKYWQNHADFWLQALRILSNPMRIPEERWHYLTSPHLLLVAALCASGLLLLVRRRQPLPLLALLSTALIMPMFNKAYGQGWDRYMLTGRYVTFLLPLALIAVAVASLALARWAIGAIAPLRANLRLRQGAVAATVALLALLVLYPLQPLFRYYTHEGRRDPDNATFLETIRLLDRERTERTPILIGAMLEKVDLKDGANSDEILAVLLTLHGVPHQVSRDTEGDLNRLIAAADPADPATAPLAILTRDECFAMRDRIPLERISGRLLLRELYWTLPSYYAIYRYNPAPPGGSCLPADGATPGD